MEKENNQRARKATIITILITIICSIVILGIIIYFVSHPKMTIVFYKTTCETEQIAENYSEEYVCAYFRLNSKGNHTLQVKDFSIFYNAKWEKAIKVEYFDQSISTQFYTYPNQPILKVYFKVPHTATNTVVFTKYKDTQMRIGEFAETR